MTPESNVQEVITPSAFDERRRTDPVDAVGSWAEMGEYVERLVRLRALPRDTADELRQKLVSQRLDLVVAGQFKRGKTSLINALIGAELLPVAVVPLTSVITLLTYGPDVTATIVYTSGESRTISPGDLADYVTERGNPNNEKGVREAHVTYPSRWLAGGIRLVDTPGVGSVYRSNTDVAQRFLPKSDAVLFVLSVDQPLSAAECEFLAGIRQYADRIFFLLNKADLLSASELRESVEFTRTALTSAIGADPTLFPLSARLALQENLAGSPSAIAPSGMVPFAHALETFLARDKHAVLAASIGRKLVRGIADARFAIDVELHALSESLDALARKSARFDEKKHEMLAAREDLQVLLGSDASRALQRPLENALQAFKKELAERVDTLLGRRYKEQKGLSLRELRTTLEAEAIGAIREGFDAWHRAQSDTIDHTFAAFCTRHGERVDAIVDELYRFAADLFAVPYIAQTEESFRDIESRFHYKFWSETTALHTLTAGVLLALPRVLGQGLVLRQARQHALGLIDMQSGRLRYDFSQRIDEALLGFRRTTVERVDAAIAAIGAAIDQAMQLRRAGESEAQLRRTALQSALRELTQIESAVARFASGTSSNAARGHPRSPARTAGNSRD